MGPSNVGIPTSPGKGGSAAGWALPTSVSPPSTLRAPATPLYTATCAEKRPTPDTLGPGRALVIDLGWFSTGRGEGSRGLLQTVLDAIHRGELNARVQFVFCNRDPGEQPGSDEFMALVRSHRVPLVTLSSQRLRRQRKACSFAEVREVFDQQVMALLAQYQPDVCVLGGYMLFTAREMVERYTMLNLHPALPGGAVGTWQDVIWKVIADRATEHGATVQVATDDWDKGPTASYVSFPVRGGDFDALWDAVEGHDVAAIRAEHGEAFPLFQRIRQEGLRRERPLLLETLKALAEGRLRVADRAGAPIPGLNLNPEVARALARPTP